MLSLSVLDVKIGANNSSGIVGEVATTHRFSIIAIARIRDFLTVFVRERKEP
jgi:hypothetical protein